MSEDSIQLQIKILHKTQNLVISFSENGKKTYQDL